MNIISIQQKTPAPPLHPGPAPSNESNKPNYNSATQPKQPNSNAPVSTDLTKQQEQFEQMFSKWEFQFEDWKKNNVNNPDQNYVKQYITDMNNMKKRLLERRKTLKEKVEQEQSTHQQAAHFPPSTSNFAQK